MLLKFLTRRTVKKVNVTTAALFTAYDQLADGNRVETLEQFHAYGRRWNVDTVTMVDDARDAVAKRFAEQSARMAARRAAGYR